ncbi:hypothetical protein PLESTM_000009300 [Pleodorina starrii]|nr:hypothetical protein PLESTM_000009300 [Pleodorina starrii]
MAKQDKTAEGEAGTEGDDVPDRLQLQGEAGREPRPYEGEGTHRFETRMSDEEIERGLGRDARRAAEVLHIQQQAKGDLVPRPSEEEAKEKALSPQITPHASQQL